MKDVTNALRLSVNCDLSEAGLEDALEVLGHPETVKLVVHPYAKHYAQHVGWRMLGHAIEVEVDPDLTEYEWLAQANGHTLWVPGP